MRTSIYLLSLLAIAIAALPDISSPPTVKVLNGTYTGLHSSAYNEDFFLGIPYAQPPVNNLRFTVPQSLNSTFSEPRAATAYSPECVGYGGDDASYSSSEDCLTLNVVRPSSHSYSSSPLPVAVWFHGGGSFMGGSADKRYNLSYIVQNSVSIGKPMIDENIAAFGGDAEKVTIWGESAGANDVGMHLLAYGGCNDKLFRAAIMESGNPISDFAIQGSAFYQPAYDAIVQATNCTDTMDTLQCLRSVPFAQFNAALNTTFAPAWGFVIDGDFVQKYGSIQFARGEFVHVPIIDGANTDEGTVFGPVGIDNDTAFLNYLENTQLEGAHLPPSLASAILSAYPIPTGIGQSGIPAEVASVPASLGLQYRRSSAYAGDALIIASRRLTCQTWASRNVPAYCYRFNAIPNGAPYTVGATHFVEVAFVFLNFDGLGYNGVNGLAGNPFAGKPESYKDLAYLMASSWASFVTDLDPNGFRKGNTGVAGRTERWPVYGKGREASGYVFDANVSSYAEPDSFRGEGTALINSAAIAFQR
ncbi:hypothetical protein MMC30_007537 [Trapelia coarctata]|nr:hypothetical protein [Trapelia coarctata]